MKNLLPDSSGDDYIEADKKNGITDRNNYRIDRIVEGVFIGEKAIYEDINQDGYNIGFGK